MTKRIDPPELLAICIVVLPMLVIAISAVTGAEPPPLGLSVPCEITEVVDGDTITARVTFECRVRLIDCWAPEIRTTDPVEKQAGLASKAALTGIALNRTGRLVIPLGEVHRFDDAITLGRVLGYVWLDPQEGVPRASTKVDVSTLQVESQHATR